MTRTQRQYVVDIIEAMANAESFIDEITIEDLRGDLKTQLALQRCFSIIGEAANKIDTGLRDRYPTIPWRKMIGMRNVMVHGYWTVSLEVVWDTVRKRFPGDKPALQQILNELPPETDLLSGN